MKISDKPEDEVKLGPNCLPDGFGIGERIACGSNGCVYFACNAPGRAQADAVRIAARDRTGPFEIAIASRAGREGLAPRIFDVFSCPSSRGQMVITWQERMSVTLDKAVRARTVTLEVVRELNALLHRFAVDGKERRMHLDLKLNNVMLDQDGHPKLIDFGGSYDSAVQGAYVPLIAPDVANPNFGGWSLCLPARFEPDWDALCLAYDLFISGTDGFLRYDNGALRIDRMDEDDADDVMWNHFVKPLMKKHVAAIYKVIIPFGSAPNPYFWELRDIELLDISNSSRVTRDHFLPSRKDDPEGFREARRFELPLVSIVGLWEREKNLAIEARMYDEQVDVIGDIFRQGKKKAVSPIYQPSSLSSLAPKDMPTMGEVDWPI